MQEAVDRLVGRAPVTGFDKKVSIYGNSQMLAILPRRKLDLPSGQHAHAGYEFIVPSKTMDFVTIENAGLLGKRDRIIAINPGQYHGQSRPQPGVHLVCLSVDDRLVNEVARVVCGKGNVCFDNSGATMDFNLRMLIRLFISEAQNRQTGYRFVLDHLSQQITVCLLRTIKNNVRSTVTGTLENSRASRKGLVRAEEYLRENYSTDFSLEDVAREAGFHPHYFIRAFKAHTGKPPYEYLLDIKIEKAKQLLLDRRLSITEVCMACGFNNPSHFATVFKRKVGMTPTQYRGVY